MRIKLISLRSRKRISRKTFLPTTIFSLKARLSNKINSDVLRLPTFESKYLLAVKKCSEHSLKVCVELWFLIFCVTLRISCAKIFSLNALIYLCRKIYESTSFLAIFSYQLHNIFQKLNFKCLQTIPQQGKYWLVLTYLYIQRKKIKSCSMKLWTVFAWLRIQWISCPLPLWPV